MTSFWETQGANRRKKETSPEAVVREYLKLGYTRYSIAKESGVSWRTINRAAKCSGRDYQTKTKKRLKDLVQV